MLANPSSESYFRKTLIFCEIKVFAVRKYSPTKVKADEAINTIEKTTRSISKREIVAEFSSSFILEILFKIQKSDMAKSKYSAIIGKESFKRLSVL